MLLAAVTPDHFDPNAEWGAGLVGLVVATMSVVFQSAYHMDDN
jgi:hypothetical protein